ncbi:MAG: type II secretion system F family protein [Comamonadaceae bacterium]|nr:MAG: type II secretion system F family protein [Comamonadaceae bacterium]
MAFSPSTLVILSLALLALGLLAFAGSLFAGEWRRSRSDALIHRAIRRSAAAIAELPASPAPAGGAGAMPGPPRAADAAGEDAGDSPRGSVTLPLHWLDSRMGRALVGDEDRRLIEQCGFTGLRAQWVFLVARIALSVLLPLLAWLYARAQPQQQITLMLGAAFFVGFMGPKWLLRRRAARRRAQAAHELPLFVDLLRLLQGVGLSLDQTLQIMAAEFNHVLPVLAHELAFANRQYAQGRSREHSLQRLATLHDNEHLAGLVSLLVQVDRHGGAVQEPLRIFGDRLRENRRSEMKEKIGKITVKMTVIMVTTLLPALIIVTAGPGFLAVVRSVGTLGK